MCEWYWTKKNVWPSYYTDKEIEFWCYVNWLRRELVGFGVSVWIHLRAQSLDHFSLPLLSPKYTWQFLRDVSYMLPHREIPFLSSSNTTRALKPLGGRARWSSSMWKRRPLFSLYSSLLEAPQRGIACALMLPRGLAKSSVWLTAMNAWARPGVISVAATMLHSFISLLSCGN